MNPWADNPQDGTPRVKPATEVKVGKYCSMEPEEMPTEHHLRSIGAPPCVGYAKYPGLDWQPTKKKEREPWREQSTGYALHADRMGVATQGS